MELNLAGNIKDKKGFYRYVGTQKETRENRGSLMNETQDLAIQDREKAKEQNAFFVSFHFLCQDPQGSQVSETKGKDWSREDICFMEKDQVREYLSKLDIPKSMGPGRIYLSKRTVMV